MPLSGENSNRQCQLQSVGSRASWSPSPSERTTTGIGEEKKRHRHQRGRDVAAGDASALYPPLALTALRLPLLRRTPLNRWSAASSLTFNCLVTTQTQPLLTLFLFWLIGGRSPNPSWENFSHSVNFMHFDLGAVGDMVFLLNLNKMQ